MSYIHHAYMITWTDTLNLAYLNKMFGILFIYSTDNVREDVLSVYTHKYI